MAAGFRYKTRYCPVLETAYTQHPRVDKSINCCGVSSDTIHVVYTMRGPLHAYTHEVDVPNNRDIVSPWKTFQENVESTYGNTTSKQLRLQGMVHSPTKMFYPYGTPLPKTGGIFTPKVTFS